MATKLLSAGDIGRRLSISRSRAYRLLHSGELHVYRLPGRRDLLRVSEEELDQWIEEHADAEDVPCALADEGTVQCPSEAREPG